MLSIPHRFNDTKFLTNIEGYHGTIHKLGRLLKHVSREIRHYGVTVKLKITSKVKCVVIDATILLHLF